MRTVSMSGFLRGNVGKKDAKKIRREGNVPCVVYGGKEQLHFYTDAKSFQKIVFTPEVCFVKLNLNEKEYDVILQDIQYHPVSDNIFHADFMELKADKPIVMNIPIKVSGVSPGVLKGGKVVQKYRKLKIKAIPENMPELIEVSINNLEIGQGIKVSDIPAEKFTILDNKNNTIVGVSVTRAVEEVAPTAEAATATAAAGAAAPAAAAAGAAGAAAPAAKTPAADAKGKAKK
ncbi:MAG TPA: 50S ribosomal protein L25/general stress protein Ctc [Bacteroidales bacterium]|nr:50S ribosomal protein L25/general stress protein Ctc [Bacteroidales bacterium]